MSLLDELKSIFHGRLKIGKIGYVGNGRLADFIATERPSGITSSVALQLPSKFLQIFSPKFL